MEGLESITPSVGNFVNDFNVKLVNFTLGGRVLVTFYKPSVKRIGRSSSFKLPLVKINKLSATLSFAGCDTRLITFGCCVVSPQAFCRSRVNGSLASTKALASLYTRLFQVFSVHFHLRRQLSEKLPENQSLFDKAQLNRHNLHCLYSLRFHWCQIQLLAFHCFVLRVSLGFCCFVFFAFCLIFEVVLNR